MNAADAPGGPPLDVRRRRTLFRARHRGMRELDLVIGAFAETAIAAMDDAALDEFEALLEVADDIVFGWIVGREPVDPDHDGPVWRAIVAFREAGGAVVPR